MEERQQKLLQQNRVKIVQDLEPRGHVLDTLLEDGVLTENDIELVSAATTRKERCHRLLNLLPTRGPSAYGSFRRALNVGQYDFLAETLQIRNDEGRAVLEGHLNAMCVGDTGSSTYSMKLCESCRTFLREVNTLENVVNSELLKLLNEHCCVYLDNIVVSDVIDQLFQDEVITEDDIDHVTSRATRRGRTEILFRVLLFKQENISNASLKEALKKKYGFILDIISRETFVKDLKKDIDYHNEPPLNVIQSLDPASFVRDPEVHPVSITEETTLKMVRDDNEIEPASLNLSTFNDTFTCHIEHQDETPVKVRCIGISRGNDVTDSSAAVQPIKFPETPDAFPSFKNSPVEKVCREIQNADTVQPSKKCPGELGEGETRAGTPELMVTKAVTSINVEKTPKRLSVAFNYLSTLINQGDYDKFESVSSKLKFRFPQNHDLMCILGYLHASRDLFRTDFDSAKRHIRSTLDVVPKTSNPRYFTLELFTAKTRMYITQKKLTKLQTTLDDAMMILETDPVGCTGRAAGWLYINNARNMTAQLSCLNLSKANAFHAYNILFEKAKSSFQRSMTNFKRDGGKDGPFGFGYALCRLVILLLRCGDNGQTMGMIVPTDDDVRSAEQYIEHLENSETPIPKILEMHFRLAKCDYQFRRKNNIRAYEHAQVAFDLATEMNLLEFTEHAQNRLLHLSSKVKVATSEDDITEAEAHRILFDDPSDEEIVSNSE